MLTTADGILLARAAHQHPGARTHKLKNIDLDIQRNQLVVITGLSVSGKSSLAFDTLYALAGTPTAPTTASRWRRRRCNLRCCIASSTLLAGATPLNHGNWLHALHIGGYAQNELIESA